MCSPTAMIATSMVVGAGQQYMQYQQQSAMASAQSRRYEKNQDNAYEAMSQQYIDIGQRQQQEQQKALQDKEKIARERRAKMATSRVAAGEAGIRGLSVEQGLRDISGAASRDITNVNTNLDWTMQSLQKKKESVRSGTTNRINSMSPGQKPSKAAAGLGLASTGIKAYGQYGSIAPKE